MLYKCLVKSSVRYSATFLPYCYTFHEKYLLGKDIIDKEFV